MDKKGLYELLQEFRATLVDLQIIRNRIGEMAEIVYQKLEEGE